MDNSNKKRFAARTISTLFVPPSFTLLLFVFFAFTIESTIDKRIALITVTLIFAFTLPILLFIYLRKHGKIIDIDATVKEERTFPFLIAILFYVAGIYILIKAQVNIISIAFWFCYISNTIFVIIINKYWKISAHMMGAAGPFAAICFVFGINAIPFILILLMIGWARIYLKCHNFYQVLAGGALGFSSTIIQLIIITRIFNA
jgi:membrane-associated phospholipid phosphatase